MKKKQVENQIDDKEELRIFINYINKFIKEGKKCLAFTSYIKNQGKTSFMRQVGEELGRIGYETLIIDGNMTEPAISKMYQGEALEGMIELIEAVKAKTIIYEEIPNYIRHDVTKHLNFLLRGGDLQSQYVDYMPGESLKPLLNSLRQRFDIILVEVDALENLSYAQSYINACDGYFLMIKAGTISMKETGAMKAKLRAMETELLGAILNQKNDKSK